MSILLKGHVNETDFSIFLLGKDSLHNLSCLSELDFEFAEICLIENRLPAIYDTGSRRLRVSVIRGAGYCIFERKIPTLLETDYRVTVCVTQIFIG